VSGLKRRENLFSNCKLSSSRSLLQGGKSLHTPKEKFSSLSQGGKVFSPFSPLFYLSAWKFANYANWLIPNTTTTERKVFLLIEFRPFAELLLSPRVQGAVGGREKKFVRARSCRKNCCNYLNALFPRLLGCCCRCRECFHGSFYRSRMMGEMRSRKRERKTVS
jgi:hypothetical protein